MHFHSLQIYQKAYISIFRVGIHQVREQLNYASSVHLSHISRWGRPKKGKHNTHNTVKWHTSYNKNNFKKIHKYIIHKQKIKHFSRENQITHAFLSYQPQVCWSWVDVRSRSDFWCSGTLWWHGPPQISLTPIQPPVRLTNFHN